MSDDIKSTLKSISEAVELYIKEILTENVDSKTSDMVFYQCSLGGKRIRPALVYLFGKMFGASEPEIFYPAASVEILHNSTLIIDDIIDHSLTRRGEPTVWAKYGKSMAECVSMVYETAVFRGLSETNNLAKLTRLYDKTLKIIMDGEINDILFERSGRDDEPFVVSNRFKQITKDDYYMMVGQKTAELIKASCQAGAITAGASDEQIELAGKFGYKIGIAFQIRDDILDIFGDEKSFGKKVGKDIIEKKMGNFIILSAFEDMSKNDKAAVISILESAAEISDDQVSIVKNIIDKTNAKKISEKIVEAYTNEAVTILDKLPNNMYSEKIKQLALFLAGREK